MLAVLLLQAAADPPSDLVVTGERLSRLSFSAQVDRKGRVRCRVKRSSGDPASDARACPAVHDCAARKLSSAPSIQACIEERLKARFEALQRLDAAEAERD
jgi:hypothetical protein